MISYNFRPKIPVRQHLYKKISELSFKRSEKYTTVDSLHSSLIDNPVQTISHFSTGLRETLDLIVKFCKAYNTVYFSQDYIADRLGICREWVNKMVKKLCSLGLISKIYRHRSTCIYKLSDFFNNLEWTWNLTGILKSLSIHVYQLKFTPKTRTIIYNSSLVSYPSFEEILRQERRDKINKKRQIVMTEAYKLLFLTQLGIAELSSFPPEAIKHAVRIFKTKKGLTDPYAWFFKVCLNYCVEHGLSRNRDITRQMVENQGLDIEGPKIDIQKRKEAAKVRNPYHLPPYVSLEESASRGKVNTNYPVYSHSKAPLQEKDSNYPWKEFKNDVSKSSDRIASIRENNQKSLEEKRARDPDYAARLDLFAEILNKYRPKSVDIETNQDDSTLDMDHD